jgi:hypothetical protein
VHDPYRLLLRLAPRDVDGFLRHAAPDSAFVDKGLILSRELVKGSAMRINP